MGMGDENMVDIPHGTPQLHKMRIGFGIHVHKQRIIDQRLRSAHNIFTAPLQRTAAGIAIAEQRGDPLAGGCSHITELHLSHSPCFYPV